MKVLGKHSVLVSQSIVKPIINWALSNSLNAHLEHSNWKPKLEVYATNMSTYF